ncbi:unnamed protein product [marine sediment metagenome]|uniref:Uncharacterized protein n=1 Tax=marine sediment metagenome TaxID=412755 RepID=X1T7V2_9ZZZZ
MGEVIDEADAIEFAQEAFKGYVPGMPTITVKPGDLPPSVKDNDYGYGLPLGSLIAQATGPAVGVTTVMQTVVPILGLGMVGMMMASVAKGMKF